MTRTIRKRKSEGVDGVSRSTQQPLVLVQESFDIEQHTNDNNKEECNRRLANAYDIMPPKKRVATLKKLGTNHNTRLDEYDHDSGRMGSQQFLHTVRTAVLKKDADKKGNKYLEESEKQAKTQHEILMELLKTHEVACFNLDESYLEKFEECYAATIIEGSAYQCNQEHLNANVEPGDSILLHMSTGIITSAQRIIQEFEACSKLLLSQQLYFSEEDTVSGNLHKITRILLAGRDLGMKKVQAMLLGLQEHTKSSDSADFNAVFYAENKGIPQHDTWAAVARKQEKGIQRITQTLL